MSQDLTPQQPQPHPATQLSPFASGRSTALAAGVNSGAVAVEQERAIAEAQGQLILAKRFPRDVNAAYEELMNACKIPAFAGAVASFQSTTSLIRLIAPDGLIRTVSPGLAALRFEAKTSRLPSRVNIGKPSNVSLNVTRSSPVPSTPMM